MKITIMLYIGLVRIWPTQRRSENITFFPIFTSMWIDCIFSRNFTESIPKPKKDFVQMRHWQFWLANPIDLHLEAGSCVKWLYIFTKFRESHSETEKGFLHKGEIDNLGCRPYKLYKKDFCKNANFGYFGCQPCTLYRVDNQNVQFRIFAKILFRFPRNFVRIYNHSVDLPLEAGSCRHEPESVHQGGITHMNTLPVRRPLLFPLIFFTRKNGFFQLKNDERRIRFDASVYISKTIRL